jgi:hypothetical protein
MRILSTYVHGIIDYGAGLLLVASPWLFGFAAEGAETWVPVVAGVLMLGASLFTDYEWGLIRQIPMPMHLGMDAILGVVLVASPWLFNFHEFVWIPHVVLGLAELGGALMTETQPSSAHGKLSTRR